MIKLLVVLFILTKDVRNLFRLKKENLAIKEDTENLFEQEED